MDALRQVWDELNGPVHGYSFGLGMFTSAVAMYLMSIIFDNWRRWLCALIVWVSSVRARLSREPRSSASPEKQLPTSPTTEPPTETMALADQAKAQRQLIKVMPTITPPSAMRTSNNPTATEYTGRHRPKEDS